MRYKNGHLAVIDTAEKHEALLPILRRSIKGNVNVIHCVLLTEKTRRNITVNFYSHAINFHVFREEK